MGTQMEGNGMELWRKLFRQYEGSDDLVKMAGKSKFMDLPQCRSMKDLDHHLDEWLHLMYQYGDDMGPSVLQTLLLRIIPSNLRAEIHRRPELKNLDLLKLGLAEAPDHLGEK